jgi:hypothetical protein
VGYLTLDRKGTIHSANLTCASLLGIERSRLTGRWFQLLLGDKARLEFNAFLGKVFEERERGTCELTLDRKGQGAIEIRLEAALCGSAMDCRVAVIDITQRKQAEALKARACGQFVGEAGHAFGTQLAEIAKACDTLLRRTKALEKKSASATKAKGRGR